MSAIRLDLLDLCLRNTRSCLCKVALKNPDVQTLRYRLTFSSRRLELFLDKIPRRCGNRFDSRLNIHLRCLFYFDCRSRPLQIQSFVIERSQWPFVYGKFSTTS